MMERAPALLLLACSASSAERLALPPAATGLGPAAAPPPVSAPAPACPPQAVIISSATGGAVSESDLFDRLARADVVYVGERHDQASHHQVQLAVLRGLHARRPRLVLGLEMLEAGQQAALDDYLAGRMSEADFGRFWQANWGFDWALYRPILEFARQRRIPARALNAPRAVIRRVAQVGLAGLSPEERRQLPATVNPTRDPRYLAYVRESVSGHGNPDPARIERMVQAQAAWNEAMAEAVLSAEAAGTPVLVIAGSGHMVYGAGIAEGVAARRTRSQQVVLPYPLDGEEVPLAELRKRLSAAGSEDRELAGHFWLLPGSP